MERIQIYVNAWNDFVYGFGVNILKVLFILYWEWSW
jgi:hypothetical protein